MQFSKQAFWIVLPIVVQLVWKAKCTDTLIDEISWGSGHETGNRHRHSGEIRMRARETDD